MEPSSISLLLLSVLTLYHQQIIVMSQCFDTKYLKTKYTALSRPDYEILDVTREELCKTHCSGNSSCAAFFYNTETSTCVLSGEPDVILNDYETEVAKRVHVKKKWYPELLVNDEGAECDDAMQFLNAHHYWNGPTYDNRDSGTVWSVTYKKTRDDTGIRFIQHHTVRGHYNAPGCSRWYITFNGAECNSPDSIEQLDYNDVAGNNIRASDVDGTCWTLPSGDVLVETVVGSCEGHSMSDSYTGWRASRTTLIMEVVPQELVKIDAANKCPPAIAFNYQYYAWSDEVDVTFDYSSHTAEVVKSVVYTKTSNETSLRVKYNALLSVKHVVDAVYCGRWFIAINGTECDPIADIVIHAQNPNNYFWANHRRVRTLEGICGNLPAGVYSLEIGVGKCPGSFYQPTNFISGGYNTASRLHIQEIRTEKSMEAKYRFHTNVYAHIENKYYNLDSSLDEGSLLSFQYIKAFTDTVLRLTATGDHRARASSGKSRCGRWYFTVDGVECSNPGSIEAVSYFGSEQNYHNPMQTSGLCHEVAQGPRTIVYTVGRCHGDSSQTDAHTGWGSAFSVVVEELRLAVLKDCGTSIPVNCDN